MIILESGDTIAFIGTHFDHLNNDTDRLKQAKQVNEIYAETHYPSILAGDLNDIPDSKTIQILENFWTSSCQKEKPKATYPSDQADKKIDYIMYYPKNRWKVIETKTICDEIASDHCAYLVSLELLK